MIDKIETMHADPGAADVLSADELHQILDKVGACLWSLDLSTHRITVSVACSRLFAAPSERPMSFAATQDLVHPDDRRARADAIGRTLRQGGAYEIDSRIVHPGGDACWLRSRGRVLLDADRRPCRHRGIVVSIDGQKRVEEELRAREAHLRPILDTVTLPAARQESRTRRRQAGSRGAGPWGLSWCMWWTTILPCGTCSLSCSRTAGFAVRLYESGTAQLERLATLASGCVLTDIRMPGLDGLDLIRQLRETGNTLRWS